MADGRDSADGAGGAHWHRPAVEAGGLQAYLQVFRERLGTIILTVAVALLAAGAYLAIADDVYEGEASLLITPAADDDPVLGRLGVIRESSDPTRNLQTVATLVTTRDVAQRVVERLDLDQSAESLLNSVEAVPVAQTDIVAITAEADTPERARNVANAFGEEVVNQRTDDLHAQIELLLPSLRAQLPGTPGPDSPESQVSLLESLGAAPDPTIRLETRASLPSSAASPRPRLTILAALLGGLILGVGGAFALRALDPRFRREEQIRERYSLPILARIPKERRAPTTTKGGRRWSFGPRRRPRRALGPGQLSRATLEGYRTLRAMLAASRPGSGHGRSVLVTGPSPSEGKTTTAIALATSLALAGNRVIFIEADFRRPSAGEALGIRPKIGIARVLLGSASLQEALIPVKPFGNDLRALLASGTDDWLAEMLSLPSAKGLLEEAAQLGDYVVVDSPPLTEVIDALPLARQVDDVVLVMRLGTSRLSQLARLADLLEQNNVTPAGVVVVGVGDSNEGGYYLDARHDRNTSDWLTTSPEGDQPESRRSRRPVTSTEA